MQEELGELSQQMFYKKAKPERYNEDNLKEELIDVILTTLCLADRFNVILSEEINKKLEKLNERDYAKQSNNN